MAHFRQDGPQRGDTTLKKKDLFITPNQGLVAANSKRHDRRLTHCHDRRYIGPNISRLHQPLIVLPTCRALNVHSVVNDSWMKKCNTVNKHQIQFVCVFDFGTPNHNSKKKRQNGLLRLSLATSTLKAKNYKRLCDLNFQTCTVSERDINIIYTDTQTQQTYVHILHRAAFAMLLLEVSGSKLNSSLCLRQHTPPWSEDIFKYKN